MDEEEMNGMKLDACFKTTSMKTSPPKSTITIRPHLPIEVKVETERISAHALFSLFTANIIKSKTTFVR